MSNPIDHRYDFSLFFDVVNGNPNGDPDAGNLPRVDPETGHGIVTDVCLKRKVRNYVDLVKGEAVDDGDVAEDGEHSYKIYVQRAAVLNERNRMAYVHAGLKPVDTQLPKDAAQARAVTRFMCDNFYDIRTFGAVMTTKVNAGKVRGPVQLCFAESIDSVLPMDIAITRMAVANADDGKDKTMGRKTYVPYGLYRANGFVSASLARKSGFDDDDLALLWDALMHMFENDRSASRGLMTSRELVVFEHDSALGNASAQSLFDLVVVSRTIPDGTPARDFTDYAIEVDEASLPDGVHLSVLK